MGKTEKGKKKEQDAIMHTIKAESVRRKIKDKNGDGANDGKSNLVLAQFFLIYKTLKSSAHNSLVLRGKKCEAV